MNKNLDRRDFAKRTSAAVGGLLTSVLFGSGRSVGQDPEMSDHRLVLLGLNALARYTSRFGRLSTAQASNSDTLLLASTGVPSAAST